MSGLSNKDLKYIYFHFSFSVDVSKGGLGRANMFYFPYFETKAIVDVATDDFGRVIYECVRQYYLYSNDIDNIPLYENKDEWQNMFFLLTAQITKGGIFDNLLCHLTLDMSVQEYVNNLESNLCDVNDLFADKIVKLPVAININEENTTLIYKILSKLEIPNDDNNDYNHNYNYNWKSFEFAVYSWYNLLYESKMVSLSYDFAGFNSDIQIVQFIVSKLLLILMEKYTKNKRELTTPRWKCIFGNNLEKFPYLLLKILHYCRVKLDNTLKDHGWDLNTHGKDSFWYTKYDYDYCRIILFMEQLMVCLESLITCTGKNNIIFEPTDDICTHVNPDSIRMTKNIGLFGCKQFDFEFKSKYYLNQMIENKTIHQVVRYIECKLFGVTYFDTSTDTTSDILKIEYILLTIEMILKHGSTLISNSLMKQINLLIDNIKCYYNNYDNHLKSCVVKDKSKLELVAIEETEHNYRAKRRADCCELHRQVIVLYCDALLCRMQLYYAIGWFKNCNGNIKNNKSRRFSTIRKLNSKYI